MYVTPLTALCMYLSHMTCNRSTSPWQSLYPKMYIMVLGHQQTYCWLQCYAAYLFEYSFTGYRWFSVTILDQMTSFKMADEISIDFRVISWDHQKGAIVGTNLITIYLVVGAVAVRGIPRKLVKPRLLITYYSVAFSFWNFAQSTAVILPCFVQNFKTIKQLKCMIRTNEFSRIWIWDTFRRNSTVQQPSGSVPGSLWQLHCVPTDFRYQFGKPGWW